MHKEPSGTQNPQRALQNKGSDTLVNLALAWAEGYRLVNPDLLIAVTGGGSGTGIASLINNTVDIANASRQMKPERDCRSPGEWRGSGGIYCRN